MYRKHPWPYGRDWTQTKYRASLLYNNRPSMRSRHINVSLSAPIVQFDELEVVNTSIRDFRNMVCHLFAANTAELLWTQHQNKYTEVTLLKSYLAALVYIWIVVALSLDINSFTSNPLARFRTEVGLSNARVSGIISRTSPEMRWWCPCCSVFKENSWSMRCAAIFPPHCPSCLNASHVSR